MFSDIQNVNILTSLLAAHGIRHAVVCPGSRNAPIVHNLAMHSQIECHPVTDERSAAFFALGIAQNTDEAVALCVTSGTALLNTLPAVAEACHQHQAIVVISADRPAAWIGQLDGQTLQQPQALQPWAAVSVTLPENDSWHATRLINEALLAATGDLHRCVHINIPISEPLFHFNTSELPAATAIRRYAPATDFAALPQPLLDSLAAAERPLIVFGQLSPRRFNYEGLDHLFAHVTVLTEALSPITTTSLFDMVSDQATPPDFILHVGDAIVSKRMKQFLRKAKAETWRISPTGDIEDTFQSLTAIIAADPEATLQALAMKMPPLTKAATEYRRQWLRLLRQARQGIGEEKLPYSERAAVRLLEEQLGSITTPFDIHYANSSAIRLANIYATTHSVWCNRGTNGIEGSLSTAAGFAATVPEGHLVLCVIGDLSFFYDQNALWNERLSPALRILLLNNHHGAIFDTLPGLSTSPAARTLVAAEHHVSAEGICQQNGVDYTKATDYESLSRGIQWLLRADSQRPMLLEALFA